MEVQAWPENVNLKLVRFIQTQSNSSATSLWRQMICRVWKVFTRV
jgi:hypothetical protein